MDTRFTDLVGCTVPVQQAPMGGVGGVSLIQASVAAGAMGTAALTAMPIPAMIELLDAVNAATPGPIGGNILVPFLEDVAALRECAERVRVVDLYHAPPDAKLVTVAHDAGALVCWQVAALDEALAAVDCGVDLLAVRGVEGGGRMAGDRSLWPLLCDVLDSVGDQLPVLAAGGIGTGRGMAAVLAAGADGIRIGTVLVATEESEAHASYKQALVEAAASDSVLTSDFSTGWPGGPHPARVLRQCIDAAHALGQPIVGEAQLGGQVMEIPTFAPPAPSAAMSGHIEAMPHYAGESVGFVHGIEPAATVIKRIVEDAAARLASTPGGT